MENGARGLARRAKVRLFQPALLTIGISLAWLPAPLQGQPGRLSCGISQVTTTQGGPAGSLPAALSADGKFALLLSTQKLAGPSPGQGLELFSVNLQDGTLVQITTLGDTSTLQNGISASRSLARVVFRSNSDLTGENPDHHSQIFLLETNLGTFHQLTQVTSDVLEVGPQPLISGNGGVVVFASTGDLVQLNEDRSVEVFALKLSTQELTQVSDLNQASEIRGFSVSRDGNELAYQVFYPLSAFSDIWLATLSTQSSSVMISGRNIALPLLTEDGDTLFLVGREDYTGDNPDRSAEIFALSTVNPLETVVQLTDFPSVSAPSNPLSNPLQISSVAISLNGGRLAFTSPINLLDLAGSPTNNLYVLVPGSPVLNQFPLASDGLVDTSYPHVLLDQFGESVLLGSRGDSAGENSDGNQEAFHATCQAAKTYFFPQVGAGSVADFQLETSFVLASTKNEISAQLEFFDPQGLPLTFDLGEEGVGHFFSLNLNRGRSRILETVAGSQLQVGYVRLSSGPGLSGTGIFTGLQKASGRHLYEAAVPLTETLTSFSIVVTNRTDLQTGLAMVNPADDQAESAVVRLRLYSSEFQLIDQVYLQLPDGYHKAQFVAEMFPEAAQMDLTNALLTAHSSQPLAVVALRQRDDPKVDFPDDIPTLTTFPVAPTTPDQPPVGLEGWADQR